MNKRAIDSGESFEKHVGKVMAKWRKRRSLTQDNIGSNLGVSGRTVGKYENCKIPIRASVMAAVSQICEFDMIEYILTDEEPLSKKFQHLARIAGRHATVHGEALEEQWDLDVGHCPDTYYDMQFATAQRRRKVRRPNEDILSKEPDNYPLPLCDDDSSDFEHYMYSHDAVAKRHILIYGYELIRLYEEMDTPRNTSESLAKQIMRRLIKEPSGQIDTPILDYYWKCVFSN